MNSPWIADKRQKQDNSNPDQSPLRVPSAAADYPMTKRYTIIIVLNAQSVQKWHDIKCSYLMEYQILYLRDTSL